MRFFFFTMLLNYFLIFHSLINILFVHIIFCKRVNSLGKNIYNDGRQNRNKVNNNNHNHKSKENVHKLETKNTVI